MEYDYYEMQLGGGTRLSCNTFGYGRISIGSGTGIGTRYSVTFSDNSFSRTDWLFGPSGNFANARLIMINNAVTLNDGPVSGGAATAFPVSYQNGGPVPATYISPFAIGDQVLVFNGGTGGTNSADISLTPDLPNGRLTCSKDLRGTFATKAGNPTTSDIAASTWAVYKNTSSGALSLWANDGGVMKSVALT